MYITFRNLTQSVFFYFQLLFCTNLVPAFNGKTEAEAVLLINCFQFFDQQSDDFRQIEAERKWRMLWQREVCQFQRNDEECEVLARESVHLLPNSAPNVAAASGGPTRFVKHSNTATCPNLTACLDKRSHFNKDKHEDKRSRI